MRVVSNTSPLSNLALIDRLDVLREQLRAVSIPPAVRAELDRHPDPLARQRLAQAFQAGWLSERALTRPIPVELRATLDPGETEALALAIEWPATLALLDESAARSKARQLAIPHTGVLGILLKARLAERIPSLREEIQKLRNNARFFVHSTLERQLLIAVNED